MRGATFGVLAAAIAIAAGACQLIDPPGPLSSGDGEPSLDGGNPDATMGADASDGSLASSDGAVADGDGGGVVDSAAACDADLARDKENCGRCGRTCFGGTCADGGCGAALAFAGPFGGMAYDEGLVYFTRDAPEGGVSTFDVATGAQTLIVDGVKTPSAIAVHAPYIVWAAGDQKIHRALLDGGAHVTIAARSEGDDLDCVAVNGTEAFWPNLASSGALRVSVSDGGAPATFLGASPLHPECIYADDRHAIFGLGSSGGFVQVDLATRAMIVSDDPGDTLSIALAGDHAYFSASPDVYHVGMGASAATKIASTHSTQVETVAADADAVYWMWSDAKGGNIAGCGDPVCATGVVTLGSGLPGFPQHALATPGAIFFFSPSAGSVYRIAR